MIAQAYLTEWGTRAPWPTATQVEQDLILSRLIVEIAEHPLLSRELAFRGGTCLHKLHLPTARRYSEDLDYVRTGSEPRLGEIFAALRDIAIERVGLRERRRRFPSEDSDVGCIWFDADVTSEAGRIRIKIEINIAETEPFHYYIKRSYAVQSRWWSGAAQVPRFELGELLATKLRALYQRRKGRDLFDLWVALDIVGIDDQVVVDACSITWATPSTATAGSSATSSASSSIGSSWRISTSSSPSSPLAMSHARRPRRS
ncbi:MAG TPA: nucleotidyl transferase AbiEii/AbiGii toxin family protein [Solirubrobacteraceae bacterium]|nr:nucleotidyl transferase AbiEii/AbiGii toxin family protein [Solirubrobacteraceae bacterium]